jgi:uncharacterized protein YndB with AHSA1/START domain
MPSNVADHEFVISRTFAASVERLWATLTSADQIAAWMGPPETKTTNLKLELWPGGVNHTRFDTPNAPPLWGKFVYREVVAPSRLVWAHSIADEDGRVIRAPWEPNWPLELLTTVVLEPVGDASTTLTLTWAPLNATPLEQDTFSNARPSMQWGWGGSFDRLADHLAAVP